MTQTPLIRPFDPERDRGGALAIDASFSTERIYRIERVPSGFVLRLEDVTPPLEKRFDLEEALKSDAAWNAAYVAEAGGAVRGFAALRWEAWNRRLVLSHLYVDRALRRSGLGRRLMARVLDAGTPLGARTAWLETSNVNVPAILAYEALGFERCGLDVTLYDGTAAEGEVAVFMARRLR